MSREFCESCKTSMQQEDYALHITCHCQGIDDFATLKNEDKHRCAVKIGITNDCVIIHSQAYSIIESAIRVEEDEIDTLIDALKLAKTHLEDKPCCV